MKTCGFKFSVMEKDVDRLIKSWVPSSFKKAVKDLRRQAKDNNLNTSCISHTFAVNAIHIRFDSPVSDRPAVTVAIEFTRLTLSDGELKNEFDRYYKRQCGGRDFAILDPRQH